MLSEQTQLNIEHEHMIMRQEFQEAQYAQQAPHVLMRPKVYPDGDHWCALYGVDLQEGVAGFGKTPEGACENFDYNWRSQILSENQSK
jgi:hypothetical protein